MHEVAIRKYELGKNLPKPEQLRKIADALNVNVNTLAEFDIQTDGDILPLLYATDEAFPATIKDVDGTPEIFFENKSLIQFLKDWNRSRLSAC
uniref:helix-turn-helix domain-containing protein n=1 Tax=Agathobacter sp. TaxID=2021311 RepID=UPI004056E42B